MQESITETYGNEFIDFSFIDTTGQDLSNYPEVQKITRAGYSFPITVINGQARLAGVVPADAVAQIVDEIRSGSDN